MTPYLLKIGDVEVEVTVVECRKSRLPIKDLRSNAVTDSLKAPVVLQGVEDGGTELYVNGSRVSA